MVPTKKRQKNIFVSLVCFIRFLGYSGVFNLSTREGYSPPKKSKLQPVRAPKHLQAAQSSKTENLFMRGYDTELLSEKALQPAGSPKAELPRLVTSLKKGSRELGRVTWLVTRVVESPMEGHLLAPFLTEVLAPSAPGGHSRTPGPVSRPPGAAHDPNLGFLRLVP